MSHAVRTIGITLAVAVALCATAGSAFGVEANWIGPGGGGNWSTGVNWTTAVVPDSTTDVLIVENGSPVYIDPILAEANSLTVGTLGTTMDIYQDGNLAITGALVLGADANWEGPVEYNTYLTADTISVDGRFVNGSMEEDESITISATSFTVEANGFASLSANFGDVYLDTAITNYGTVNIDSTNDERYMTGSFINHGTVEFGGNKGDSLVFAEGNNASFQNYGTWIGAANETAGVRLASDGNHVNEGNLQIGGNFHYLGNLPASPTTAELANTGEIHLVGGEKTKVGYRYADNKTNGQSLRINQSGAGTIIFDANGIANGNDPIVVNTFDFVDGKSKLPNLESGVFGGTIVVESNTAVSMYLAGIYADSLDIHENSYVRMCGELDSNVTVANGSYFLEYSKGIKLYSEILIQDGASFRTDGKYVRAFDPNAAVIIEDGGEMIIGTSDMEAPSFIAGTAEVLSTSTKRMERWTVEDGGTLTFNTGSASKVDNSGTRGTVEAGGEVLVDTGASYYINGSNAGITNAGLLTVKGSVTQSASDKHLLVNDGTISMEGGTLNFRVISDLNTGGIITGNGTIGDAQYMGGGTMTNDGEIEADGGTMSVKGMTTLVNNGTLTVNTGDTLDIVMTQGGDPNAVPVTQLTTGSTTDVYGTLSISNGALDFQAGADLWIALGGANEGLLTIDANVAFDGTINVTDLGSLAEGNYQIATYTGDLESSTATFGDTAGFTASLDTSTAGSIVLVLTSGSSVLTGDVNGDGLVNADDINAFVDALTMTEAEFNTNWPSGEYDAADVNGDTLINADDINPFVTLLTGGGTVPEPATLVLLGLGGLAVIRRRRK